MNVLAADVANYLSEDIVQGKLLAYQTKLQNEQVHPYLLLYLLPTTFF